MCINEKNTIENFRQRPLPLKGCPRPLNINQWHFLMKSLFGQFSLMYQRMQGDGSYKCNLPASCPIPSQKPFCLSTGGWVCDNMRTPFGLENIKS